MRIPTLEELPAAPRAIVLHWTGGAGRANAVDLDAYHYVIEADGTVREGVPVANNMRNLSNAQMSTYAAHTRAMNSYRAGLAAAGMLGATPQGPYGRYPITEAQVRAMCQWVARLCEVWRLEVTPETVFHHAEAQTLHGVPQAGKWDITVLPWAPEVEADEVGPLLREWVREAMTEEDDAPLPEIAWLPESPDLIDIPPATVSVPDFPSALRSPAHALTPALLRRELTAEGFDDGQIDRIARVMERVHAAAEGAVRWWDRAGPLIRDLVRVWRAVRGSR